MPLQVTLTEFRTAVGLSSSLIAAVHTLSEGSTWTLLQRELVTEAAFVRAFIAWETFLETAFTQYMMGEASSAGNRIAGYVSPPDPLHAVRMTVGLRHHMDWTTPDTVVQLASLYFCRGNPFELVLRLILVELRDLKTIRNAAVHLSSSTSSELDILARRILGRGVVGIKVYDLILATDPRSPTKSSVLQGYLDVLDTAAAKIISI